MPSPSADANSAKVSPMFITPTQNPMLLRNLAGSATPPSITPGQPIPDLPDPLARGIRTTDPDVPPALLERLTRTALSVTRSQHRILRTLRPANGVSLLADKAMWEHWKQALLEQEAALVEASKAGVPA